MSFRAILTMLVLVGWSLIGCQKPTNSNLAEAEPAPANAPANLRPDSGPDEVVTAFLNAARSGDESLATQLLTSKAREETEKEGLSLDPPGTPTMRFRIEKVEYVADIKDAAYVNSVWTDSGVGLVEDPFEVVWVLRRQTDGWRIAGMAAQINPGEPIVFLNFEEPSDVLRLRKQLDGEPNREPTSNVRQASYLEPLGSTDR